LGSSKYWITVKEQPPLQKTGSVGITRRDRPLENKPPSACKTKKIRLWFIEGERKSPIEIGRKKTFEIPQNSQGPVPKTRP